VTLTALLGALPAATAQAATASCPTATESQPFTKWRDSNYYSLVPEGNFEGSLSEWKLSGASKVAGSETYGVTGSVGGYSLLIPPGASARSPFMCVTEVDRSFRLFVRAQGSSASLDAEVVYKTASGNVSATVATVTANGTWQPTESLHTGAAKAVTNGTAQLALRFKGDSGNVRIDDVYLDPRRH